MARPEGDHDGHGPAPTATHTPLDGAPTESLVAGTVGDRCVKCGAPLSSDQRYCVNCGERRGAPRFSVPAAGAEPTGETTTTTVMTRQSRRPRFSSGATLIAGVGTLLLAMGVGVLIGHNTSNSGSKTPATQVITVNGGGGTPTTSAGSSGSAGSASANAGSGSHHKGGGKAKSGKGSGSASKPPSKKVAQKAQQAASKVLGGSNTPPPTVTVGQKGSGAGYNKKTHKFDGSFFGQ